jgi:hypothetical protein
MKYLTYLEAGLSLISLDVLHFYSFFKITLIKLLSLYVRNTNIGSTKEIIGSVLLLLL